MKQVDMKQKERTILGAGCFDFCPNCKHDLRNTVCAKCLERVDRNWKHCTGCGADLHPENTDVESNVEPEKAITKTKSKRVKLSIKVPGAWKSWLVKQASQKGKTLSAFVFDEIICLFIADVKDMISECPALDFLDYSACSVVYGRPNPRRVTVNVAPEQSKMLTEYVGSKGTLSSRIRFEILKMMEGKENG